MVDDNGLVTRCMSSCRHDGDAGCDLLVTIDHPLEVLIDARPLGDREPREIDRAELNSLDIHGNCRQESVLTAVIEVKVRVNDRHQVALVDTAIVECLDDRRVVLVQEFVIAGDAGVDDHDPVGMMQHETCIVQSPLTARGCPAGSFTDPSAIASTMAVPDIIARLPPPWRLDEPSSGVDGPGEMIGDDRGLVIAGSLTASMTPNSAARRASKVAPRSISVVRISASRPVAAANAAT